MTCATTEACHGLFSLLYSIPGTVCPTKISEPGSKVAFQKCQVSASPACIYSFPDRQKTANIVGEGKLLLPPALFVSSFQDGPGLFCHTGLVPGYLEKPNWSQPTPQLWNVTTFSAPQAVHNSVEKGFGNQRPVPLEVPYLLPAERISPSSDLQDQRIPKHLGTSLVIILHP